MLFVSVCIMSVLAMSQCVASLFEERRADGLASDTTVVSAAKPVSDVLDAYRPVNMVKNDDGQWDWRPDEAGQSYTFELSGEDKAAQWTRAVQLSQKLMTQQNSYVYVRLTEDWQAENSGGGAPKFGTGYGFAGSGSAIPEGLLTVTTENKIIFDLNGHVVDRNIGEGQSGGVFYVPGTLIICDSDPTAAHYKDKDGGDGIENAKYTYELSQPGNVSDTVKQAVYGGMITGGKTNGSSQWGDSLGGGIRVYGTGTLRMFGGTVYGNYSNLQGGGIYGSTNATNISLMEIDGGNVIGNSCGETDNTDTRGGGIFSNGTLKIVSGNVLANSSRSGAGVCLGASGSMEMSGGMISYNRGFGYNSQGGGIYSESGKIAMTGGKVLYNGNVGYGGGVYSFSEAETLLVAGGEIAYNNASTYGGGVYTKGNVQLGGYVESGAEKVLRGGKVYGNTVNRGYNYYAVMGAGIYFRKEKGAELLLCGPSVLKQNRRTEYDDGKEDVENNVVGQKYWDNTDMTSKSALTVKIIGKLEATEWDGTEEVTSSAEIYLNGALAPIADYGKYNHMPNGAYIDPNKYLHFSESGEDAMCDDGGNVIYSAQFTFWYYHAVTSKYVSGKYVWCYDVDENGDYVYDNYDRESKHNNGDEMAYGTYGLPGAKIKAEGRNGGNDEFIVFRYCTEYEIDSDGKIQWITNEAEDNKRSDKTLLTVVGTYVGVATVTDDNGDNYSITLTITVAPKDLADVADDIAISATTAEFNGTAITPAVEPFTVTWTGEHWGYSEETLDWNDLGDWETPTYKVTYENNTHVGEGPGRVIIEGTGNYGGKVVKLFTITQPKDGGDNVLEYDTGVTWQKYNGAQWVSVSGGSGAVFTYTGRKNDHNVRAVLSATFANGASYSAYVYAPGGTAADLKLLDGDTVPVDPGLRLEFSGAFEGKPVDSMLNAAVYTVEIEKANDYGGDFALPAAVMGTNMTVDPAVVDFTDAFDDSERSNALLAVRTGNEGAYKYIPLKSDAVYIENGNEVEGNNKYYYAFYNGEGMTVVLNPEYRIEHTLFGEPFENYVKTINYTHKVGNAEDNAPAGEAGKVTAVKTTFTFTLNSNFRFAPGTDGSVEKDWAIVTAANVIGGGDFGSSEITFGSEVSDLPGPEYGDTLYITLYFGQDVADAVVLQGNALYEYDDNAADKKGDIIRSGAGEYFRMLLMENGAGEYTLTVKAPDWRDSRNVLYRSEQKEFTFTVSKRSIQSDPDLVISFEDETVYTGSEVTVAESIVWKGITLVADKDYKITYKNNINANVSSSIKATAIFTGIGNYTGTVEKTFTIKAATDNSWTTSLSIAPWIYGTFNREISTVIGHAKYGDETAVFEIEPAADTKDKLTQEQIARLKNIRVPDGMIPSELVDLFRSLPVGNYLLKAAVAATDNYNALPGTYAFRVLPTQYKTPSFGVISAGVGKNDTFNGNLLSMGIIGYDPLAMNVEVGDGLEFNAETGTVYATDAGTYRITVSLKYADESAWSGGGADQNGKVDLTWTVAPKVVQVPTSDPRTFMVNGKTLTYMPGNFDADVMRIVGNKQDSPGRYDVTVYLTDDKNYVWSDGTNGARTFTWEVQSATKLFTIVMCELCGVVLLAGACALGQFLKHKARMADLAEADAASGNNGQGGNI